MHAYRAPKEETRYLQVTIPAILRSVYLFVDMAYNYSVNPTFSLQTVLSMGRHTTLLSALGQEATKFSSPGTEKRQSQEEHTPENSMPSKGPFPQSAPCGGFSVHMITYLKNNL
jgi:hypothetical protein